jgi:hypothetical protein
MVFSPVSAAGFSTVAVARLTAHPEPNVSNTTLDNTANIVFKAFPPD